MMRVFKTALAISISLVAMPLAAQTGPQQRTISIQFTGVVTNEISDTIKVRQPDGSFSTFTGPVPDYPYKKGDSVTIGYNTIVPTKAYYDEAYRGQIAADGIYRIQVIGTNNGSLTTFGQARNFDVSGPISPVPSNGQPLGLGGMIIVYDSNKDSYSLELPGGAWSASKFDAPGYNYDPATGRLTPSQTSCLDGTGGSCVRTGDGGFALTGDQRSVSANNIPIYNTAGALPENAGRTGGFSLLFAGIWNLPFFGSGGGDPVDVPEPASVLFFGAGAGLLGWRRRRALRKAG